MLTLSDERAREAIQELRQLFGTVIMEAPEYVPSVEDGLAVLKKWAESAPQEAGALIEVMLREFGTILAAEYDGEWGMYEMDGCECEEMLVRVGLIEKVKMQEACGENCSCAEYGEFPMDCNRTTELGKKALKLAERGVPLEETKNA